MLRLVGHQVLFNSQITVAVGVGVRIRATIRQVGKQVLYVVVGAESKLYLLHVVHQITNSQMCGHAYSFRYNYAHLVEFRADAAIDYISKGSTIVHTHVIFVLEAIDLWPRHTLRHRLMFYVHRIVNSWDGLWCVAHGERGHFGTLANDLDDRITFGFVFEVAHIFSVEISITTSEVRKVPITYLAEIESVSKVRAQVNFFGQVLQKEIKIKRVGVRVQYSDFFSKTSLTRA